MKNLRSFFTAILIIVISTFGIVGCSIAKGSSNSPTDAINEIRKSLELPELPIEFVENTSMVNSPSGGLEVANYKDSEGRIYSVNPKTNLVVEIDARTVLSNISPNAPLLSPDEITAKAMKYIRAVIPNFETQQSLWQYDEIAAKGENYFFTWYGEFTSDLMNRPFLQIGIDRKSTRLNSNHGGISRMPSSA